MTEQHDITVRPDRRGQPDDWFVRCTCGVWFVWTPQHITAPVDMGSVIAHLDAIREDHRRRSEAS